jgi:hypothetical protein
MPTPLLSECLECFRRGQQGEIDGWTLRGRDRRKARALDCVELGHELFSELGVIEGRTLGDVHELDLDAPVGVKDEGPEVRGLVPVASLK